MRVPAELALSQGVPYPEGARRGPLYSRVEQLEREADEAVLVGLVVGLADAALHALLRVQAGDAGELLEALVHARHHELAEAREAAARAEQQRALVRRLLLQMLQMRLAPLGRAGMSSARHEQREEHAQGTRRGRRDEPQLQRGPAPGGRCESTAYDVGHGAASWQSSPQCER